MAKVKVFWPQSKWQTDRTKTRCPRIPFLGHKNQYGLISQWEHIMFSENSTPENANIDIHVPFPVFLTWSFFETHMLHAAMNSIKGKKKLQCPKVWPHPTLATYLSEVWVTIGELTVQVWLLYHQLIFEYFTLNLSRTEWWINIVVAFQGMHVSPVKHSYAWLPRKCEYWTDRHRWTDRQTPDKVIPMCRYASLATQKDRYYMPQDLSGQEHKKNINTCTSMPAHSNYFRVIASVAPTCIYLRWVSSLRTWAICRDEIFSRPVRAWIPTMVTPIGQGALPMAISRYASLACNSNNSNTQHTSYYHKWRDFLATSTGVDSHHGDSDRPGGITDGHL